MNQPRRHHCRTATYSRKLIKRLPQVLQSLPDAGREAASGQVGAIHKALLALALFAAVAFLPRLVRRLRGQRRTDAGSAERRLESGEEVAPSDERTADKFRGQLGHIAGRN